MAVRSLSLWVASPGVLSRPLRRLVGSRVAALFLIPPLPGDKRKLTQCPRREVVSGPVTRGVPTSRLLGDMLWQLGRSLFGMPAWGPSRPLSRLAGSWVAAPLFAEVTLFQRGTASDNTFEWTIQLNNAGVHP